MHGWTTQLEGLDSLVDSEICVQKINVAALLRRINSLASPTYYVPCMLAIAGYLRLEYVLRTERVYCGAYLEVCVINRHSTSCHSGNLF